MGSSIQAEDQVPSQHSAVCPPNPATMYSQLLISLLFLLHCPCGEAGVGLKRSRRSCAPVSRPFCGSDGNTYDNPCAAPSNVVSQCDGPCPCEGGGRICTAEYRPVCGRNGRTYSNLCQAGKIGVACEGPCPCRSGGGGGRICTAEYRPVCGQDGRTYSNPCQAGDVTLACKGKCPCRRRTGWVWRG